MRNTVRLLAVFVFAVIAFGPHSTAAAADQEQYQNHWNFHRTFARFESVDSSGCIQTTVLVEVDEAWGVARVSVYKYDLCNYIYLVRGSGEVALGDAEFQVSESGSQATLDATIHVEDYWGEFPGFDVSVDLTWTATGALNRDVRGSRLQNPTCKELSKSQVSWRDAEVSGTVTDGETDFTPAPSVYGTITNVKAILITMGCEYMPSLESFRQTVPFGAGGPDTFTNSYVATWFYVPDPSGCISTYGIAFVHDITVNSSQIDASPLLTVGINQYDACTGDELIRASVYSVPLDDQDFKRSGNSATLHKTVTLDDYIRNISFDVFIDLTWQASGPRAQETSTFQSRTPDCRERVRETLDWRAAQVFGTLSDGVTNFASYSQWSEVGRYRYLTDGCE